MEEDEEASLELLKIEEEHKKEQAFSFMEQDDDQNEDMFSSVMKALPSIPMFIGKGEAKHGKVPPPPSEQDPYDLIETKK